MTWLALSLLLAGNIFIAHGFSTRPQHHVRSAQTQHTHDHRRSTSLSVIGAGAASILAGSVGGAIGVGVAYPLDTLKTKSQVYGQQQSQGRTEQPKSHHQSSTMNTLASNGTTAVMLPPPGVVCTAEDCYPIESPEDNLISLVKVILDSEGIAGFYGGVKAMMIGQAIIKSIAFSTNAFALGVLSDSNLLGVANSVGSAGVEEMGGTTGGGEDVVVAATPFMALLVAAAFSGFVTSFIVAPVERVKVMMQAQQNSLYANELECIQAVLENEGWTGLFSRGLGPTLAREVPSYAIYFVVYGVLRQTPTAEALGSVAPLVCGALSGMACWVPVYPIDVVKTLVQNTEGGDSDSAMDVAVQLYKDEGVGAFYNGLTPKMLRASVNHAVTFWVYDLMIGVLV